MAKNYDIVVVGAGLIGMSIAISLARYGLKIAILEKNNIKFNNRPEADGRVSAIALGSKLILDDIGVWSNITKYAEPILDIIVTDGDSPYFIHYDHAEVSTEPFGFIVENNYIRHGLYESLRTYDNIEIIENFIIDKADNHKSEAVIYGTGNSVLNAKLLVVADGRNSKTAKSLGIKYYTSDYKQTAIVCTIEHELPHHGLAQEKFFPVGPFAVLPMQGNFSSLVWVEPSDRVNCYIKLDNDEFITEISERVGKYLGSIKNVGNRFSYPLSASHAKSYIANRCVVIGDAAHGIHPIAGQGVNVGFRDVQELSNLIKEQILIGGDIGDCDILKIYENRRIFDNSSMIAITDILNKSFSNNILPIKLVRRFGLLTIGKMPILKKMFMRHAMGINK
ncbi:MAG: UbiH/UbiF/VisC/COQ6 family ubiquinone biosynthesis hydroxylase [Rickettsiales bacterium]